MINASPVFLFVHELLDLGKHFKLQAMVRMSGWLWRRRLVTCESWQSHGVRMGVWLPKMAQRLTQAHRSRVQMLRKWQGSARSLHWQCETAFKAPPSLFC